MEAKHSKEANRLHGGASFKAPSSTHTSLHPAQKPKASLPPPKRKGVCLAAFQASPHLPELQTSGTRLVSTLLGQNDDALLALGTTDYLTELSYPLERSSKYPKVNFEDKHLFNCVLNHRLVILNDHRRLEPLEDYTCVMHMRCCPCN